MQRTDFFALLQDTHTQPEREEQQEEGEREDAEGQQQHLPLVISFYYFAVFSALLCKY